MQVDKTFPLADVRKAHEFLAAAQVKGKIVLVM